MMKNMIAWGALAMVALTLAPAAEAHDMLARTIVDNHPELRLEWKNEGVGWWSPLDPGESCVGALFGIRSGDLLGATYYDSLRIYNNVGLHVLETTVLPGLVAPMACPIPTPTPPDQNAVYVNNMNAWVATYAYQLGILCGDQVTPACYASGASWVMEACRGTSYTPSNDPIYSVLGIMSETVDNTSGGCGAQGVDCSALLTIVGPNVLETDYDGCMVAHAVPNGSGSAHVRSCLAATVTDIQTGVPVNVPVVGDEDSYTVIDVNDPAPQTNIPAVLLTHLAGPATLLAGLDDLAGDGGYSCGAHAAGGPAADKAITALVTV